jgi:hypothetical protein
MSQIVQIVFSSPADFCSSSAQFVRECETNHINSVNFGKVEEEDICGLLAPKFLSRKEGRVKRNITS